MRLLKRIEKASILVLDDWGLSALGAQDRADLLEILDDRVPARSTILISQLPVDTWHAYLGEPTLADAILDRLPGGHRKFPHLWPGQSPPPVCGGTVG